MNKEEVKIIIDSIKEAVGYQVELQINGNLRDIKKHLGEQDEKLEKMKVKIDSLKVETAPLIESRHVFVGLRNFLVWIATPIAIMYAIYEFLAK
jgi:hypothetical protein